MNIESMENINNESKSKFTPENNCECGYPSMRDHHKFGCPFYGKEGHEFEKNEKKRVEEFIGGWKEEPELPESEFGKYQEVKAEKKEKKEEEKKEESKPEISVYAKILVEKIWENELKPYWDIIKNRKDAFEYVSKVVTREIDSAMKKGKLPSDKEKKEVLDTLELKCIEEGMSSCELIIWAKSKHYEPIEKNVQEKIKKIKEQKKRK